MNEYKEALRESPGLYMAAAACCEGREDYASQMDLMVWIPPLVEYVCWVLRSAREKGIERLYFLSRDAWLMYRCAQAMVKELDIPIDCRYLRVSRRSLRFPEYHLLGKDCVDMIFLSGIDVSMRTILRRGGLTDDEMAISCREVDYTDDLDRILNRGDILWWKKVFRSRGNAFVEYVKSHSLWALADCMGYLKEQGLTENVSWAVVDSGWVGTLQRSLRNLLNTERPGIEVEGFYFGLYETPSPHTGCRYNTYYFSPRGDISKKVYFSNCLYEIVYSEPEGMTVGYAPNGGFTPVLSPEGILNVGSLKRRAELLDEFMAKYLCTERAEILNPAPVAETIYRKVMGNPTAKEASYYGSMKFSDDVTVCA